MPRDRRNKPIEKGARVVFSRSLLAEVIEGEVIELGRVLMPKNQGSGHTDLRIGIVMTLQIPFEDVICPQLIVLDSLLEKKLEVAH